MNFSNPLLAISLVAEEKILEAEKKGEFDNLPGRGKPLQLEDDSHIPPEMRMVYKILSNSGYSSTSLKNGDSKLSNAKEISQSHYRNMVRLNLALAKAKKKDSFFNYLIIESSPYFGSILKKVQNICFSK